MILKVYYEISVSFRLVENWVIPDLLMANIENSVYQLHSVQFKKNCQASHMKAEMKQEGN